MSHPVLYWYISDVLKALMPIVVALVAWYFAWRQLQTTRHKLNLDLFERRIEIYKAAERFIAEILDQSGNIETSMFNFHQSITESEFLFPKDVVDFLHRLTKEAWKVRGLRLNLASTKPTNTAVTESLTTDVNKINEWAEESYKTLAERFRTYLDFSNVR